MSIISKPLPIGSIVRVAAPGSVANVVCGFDVLGFALNEPYDVMTVTLLDEPVIRISSVDAFHLPTRPEDNVAGGALLALLEKLDGSLGFAVSIDKRIKPGSGIGSSAASAAGAVVAANHLLGGRFSQADLVGFAMMGEKIASGVPHADNVAPCIYGGMTLIRSLDPLDIVRLSVPELYVSIVHPQIEVRTADARAILRPQVNMKDAVRQWANVGGLVAGILQQDYALIGRSLEDHIVEPIRSILIPAFAELKAACLAAGALGGGISGSGPSVFMLSQDEATARRVQQAMTDCYTRIGLDFHSYVTTINNRGVWVLP